MGSKKQGVYCKLELQVLECCVHPVRGFWQLGKGPGLEGEKRSVGSERPYLPYLPLSIQLYLTLCSSRNCPYPPPPPWKGFFSMTPSPLWIFQKLAPKTDPPSPPEIPFLSHTPWKYYHSLWKPKIRYFFSCKILNFDPYHFFFFQKIWWILWPTHH